MIIILKQHIAPTLPGETATIAVEIAISNNGTWYLYHVGGIPTNTPDVQAALNAREAELLALAQAAGQVIPPGKVEAYKIFVKRPYWLAASLQVRLEMQNASSLITALNNIVAKLDDDATEFTTFGTYKTARGIATGVTPTDISAMTAAQRQTLLAIIVEFLSLHLGAIGYISAAELFD